MKTKLITKNKSSLKIEKNLKAGNNLSKWEYSKTIEDSKHINLKDEYDLFVNGKLVKTKTYFLYGRQNFGAFTLSVLVCIPLFQRWLRVWKEGLHSRLQHLHSPGARRQSNACNTHMGIKSHHGGLYPLHP